MKGLSKHVSVLGGVFFTLLFSFLFYLHLKPETGLVFDNVFYVISAVAVYLVYSMLSEGYINVKYLKSDYAGLKIALLPPLMFLIASCLVLYVVWEFVVGYYISAFGYYISFNGQEMMYIAIISGLIAHVLCLHKMTNKKD